MLAWLTISLILGVAVGTRFVPTAGELRAAFEQGQRFYASGAYEQAIDRYRRVTRSESGLLDEKAVSARASGDYTRRQMLAEPRFYYMLPAMIATPMIGTALFFFPDEIARAKGWSSLWVTGNYWLYSIVSVATTVCCLSCVFTRSQAMTPAGPPALVATIANTFGPCRSFLATSYVSTLF